MGEIVPATGAARTDERTIQMIVVFAIDGSRKFGSKQFCQAERARN
jgi:hypothetical protein